MIFQVFVCLLLLALLSLPAVKSRLYRLGAAIIAAGCGFVLFRLWEALRLRETSVFIYEWLSYRGLQAVLNLSSNFELEQMLLPLFMVALLVVYYNSIYHPEEQRFAVCSVILLNLASFILLAESADFIQLMVGSCAFTLGGFYLINETEAKRKFIFYSFLGEMALFTALSIVYSRMGAISLGNIEKYRSVGEHRDLVAMLVLFAIIVKAGIFPLQNQLQDLRSLTFNRLLAYCFTSAPLAAFVLCVKLHPLLLLSGLTMSILSGLLAVTLIWGLAGCLIIDSLKAKVLYLNMLFYGFVLALLTQDWQSFGQVTVWLFFPVFLLNLVLIMVNLSSSNETYVSQMGGFMRRLKWTFALSLAAVLLFVAAVLKLTAAAPLFLVLLFLCGMLVGLAQIFHDIYLAKSHADERVEALLKNTGPQYWLPALLAGSFAVWKGRLVFSQAVWAVFAAFIIGMTAGAFSFAGRWADDEELQDADLTERLYLIFVLEPLRLLGRILWVAVDFVVIERSIIGTVSDTTRFLVGGLHKIQSTAWVNYLLMVLTGLGIIGLSIGYYSYE